MSRFNPTLSDEFFIFIEDAGADRNRHRLAKVTCKACETEVVRPYRDLRKAKSCGCLQWTYVRDDDATERFSTKYVVRIDTGCWEWTAAIQSSGYGSFGYGGKGKTVLAHRWSYEHHVGPISTGLTIDHLCHNTRCVNPKHLEPVTLAENNRRATIHRAAEAI